MNVVIVGAGLSGLCMGAQLDALGIPFVILEKSPQVGGTWWENTYPGCACDIPSHLYAFSFAPDPEWSRLYPPQAEILRYVERFAAERGLLDRIRFGVEVTEARWDEAERVWRVATRGGGTFAGDALVSAVGALHAPRYPDLPGRDRYEGAAFHSSSWDPGVALEGRRVGVIGSAASAVQLVPPVAEEAAEVFVFQRTPSWVAPRGDRPYSARARRALRWRPLQTAYRWWLYLYHEALFLHVFRRGSWGARRTRRWLERRLEREVPDPSLRAALTPDYAVGCKRVLLSDDFYPALQREHVHLVTEPLQEIRPAGPATAERTYPVDVLVYATGFDPMAWGHVDVVGRGGVRLQARWGDAPRAHLGITVPGFPNYFVLLGPHTGLGHNSVVWMVECQVRYVLRCLQAMRRRGWRTLEVREEALEAFARRVDRRMQDMVWTGCRSWYQNEAGMVTALWPSTTVRYWWETRRPVLGRDFVGRR